MEAAILKMPCFKASLRSVPPPHLRLRGTLKRPIILVSLALSVIWLRMGLKPHEGSTLAFFGVGEDGLFHCIDDDFISGSK